MDWVIRRALNVYDDIKDQEIWIILQKFEFKEIDLEGEYVIKPFCAIDKRGGLIKDFNTQTLKNASIDYDLKETFYTIDKRNVIRAIHFQHKKPKPKLMRCIGSRVFYAIIDLHSKSETYGQYRYMELSGDDSTCVVCPAGFV